jgi:DNA invertase Pin-like site-specific DNA recombinase
MLENQKLSKQAAIYGRSSTDKQEQSIDAQQSRMLAWANANDFTIEPSAVFLEDDTSGSIPFAQRPKGRMLLALLREGRIRHVIVPKIDRLGRSAMDVLNTIDHLTKAGIRTHIIDLGGQHFDTGSAIGGMIIAVLAYAAQMELERIRERIQTVLDHKASKSELIGTVPYGFDAIETGEVTGKGVKVRRLVPNETEVQWLRQMAAWRQQGLSYSRIARHLNELGVPTKTGGGTVIRYKASRRWPNGRVLITRGKWQCGNVARVLNSKQTKRLLIGNPNS